MDSVELLRERRRAKILQNSEDRMKKLLGCNRLDSDPTDVRTLKQDQSKIDVSRDFERFSRNSVKKAPDVVKQSAFPTTDIHSNPNRLNDPVKDEVTELKEESMDKVNNCFVLQFYVMLLAGCLIRLMLGSSMKLIIYKENVLYPFVILQVFIFFSKPDIMKFNQYRDSTILCYILHFLGTGLKLKELMLFLYSMLRTILNDFSVFMFTFLITHYCYSLSLN